MRRRLAVLQETEGIRRLLAIVAFGAPPVVRAAERWWRDSLKDAADEVEVDTESTRDVSVLTAVIDKTTRPLTAVASTLQDAFTQIRELTRGLQQEEIRRTQLLAKQATEVTKGHDAILRELARHQSWAGEQQRSLRSAVSELATALRALESRMDRFEGSSVRDLVGRVGATGVALERGQLTVARRELARLRAGARRVGIFVDAVNLSASAREAYNSGVRYGALRDRGRGSGISESSRRSWQESPTGRRKCTTQPHTVTVRGDEQ